MYVNPADPAAIIAPFSTAIDHTVASAAAEKAAALIPPAWPLSATVAVNPFLGQIDNTLVRASSRLARLTPTPMMMPRQWYRDHIANGRIEDSDLTTALAETCETARPSDISEIKSAVLEEPKRREPLPTIAALSAAASMIDWPALLSERVGAWAGGYFDEGQALWASARNLSAFAAWRAYATHDLTPEIAGLKGFANFVDSMPVNAMDAIVTCVQKLRLSPLALESYFHQLLLSLAGWSQYARYKRWQAELQGRTDNSLVDLLAVRLVWEAALFERYQSLISQSWAATSEAHAAPQEDHPDIIIDDILQRAYEYASQRKLALKLAGTHSPIVKSRPLLQAAFCIDVRSEIFRRSLESVDARTRTLGFAGFFGLPISHRRAASDTEELRLPVLLNPRLFTCTPAHGSADIDQPRRLKGRAKRAWGRFKLAAVSSFAFVEAAGLSYVGKLIKDTLALKGTQPPYEATPDFRQAVGRKERASTAVSILQAMSLTKDFSRLVILVGHGASVVNNPHASSLHCGACGGYSGEVNARLLAQLLNAPDVREDLSTAGIVVPADTLFVGALHDTTTDTITLYSDDPRSASHTADIAAARRLFEKAGALTRSERSLRMRSRASSRAIIRRSRDWAEVRPEWALAGCHAFIAAPRTMTSGTHLDGRVFLHDYDWRLDKDFSVLELILTAPVVVASWINLQYYGSTVAPDVFGGGNKLLHNVVGGIGVIEGNSGLLRTGLPWQSVHDGAQYVHDPVRLAVCVAAPAEAVTAILAKHPAVKALFDNQWLYLYALNDCGKMTSRYLRGAWLPFETHGSP